MDFTSLQSKKHISRTGRGWIYALDPLNDGETTYFKDSAYGGDRLRSLVAALIARFMHELPDASVDHPLASLQYTSRKSTNTGYPGISYTDNNYYKINISQCDGQSSLSVSIDLFGEQLGLYLAVSIRHIYLSYLYGDAYHIHRNKPDNSYPDDQTLKKLGIDPQPDISAYEPNAEHSSEEPAAEQSPSKLHVRHNKGQETYPGTEIPKTNGIYYQKKGGLFLAYFHKKHTPQQTIHPVGNQSPEKAFAEALRDRHNYLSTTYGDQYDALRNNPGNNLPDDNLLKKYGINEASD